MHCDFFLNGIFKGLESGVMYNLVRIYNKNLNLCDLNMFTRTVGVSCSCKEEEELNFLYPLIYIIILWSLSGLLPHLSTKCQEIDSAVFVSTF